MKIFSGPESRISILIFPRFNLERQLYSLLMVIKSPFLLKQKNCPDPGASNFNSKYKQNILLSPGGPQPSWSANTQHNLNIWHLCFVWKYFIELSPVSFLDGCSNICSLGQFYKKYLSFDLILLQIRQGNTNQSTSSKTKIMQESTFPNWYG